MEGRSAAVKVIFVLCLDQMLSGEVGWLSDGLIGCNGESPTRQLAENHNRLNTATSLNSFICIYKWIRALATQVKE